jgi:hypothetical protein
VNMTLSMKLLAPGMFVWYLLIPCFIFGLIFCFRNKRLESFPIYGTILLTLTGGLYTFYAFGFRFIVQIIPLNLILTAIGIHDFQRWRIAYSAFVFVIIIVWIIYLCLKLRTIGII